MKRLFFITLGWLLVGLALIGVFLPLLPTTPFLILALACFAEHSPRFHRMLLNHKWFGPPLRDWQATKSMRRPVKIKVYWLIIVMFTVSIGLLWGRWLLQLMLVFIGLVLLWFISRISVIESEHHAGQ